MDAIREALIDLMANNNTFISAIELSTSSKQAVEARFDIWRSVLRQAVGSSGIEPRCFSAAVKAKLFEKASTCAICQQRIAAIDDSAVDHVEQYWQGGKTIDENARLTHRYCNWSRPRNNVVGSG
jgi:hypothetical protein